ncbi:alpha-N-arabinofuranosidase [Roseateles saccharophilus]|uniref:non-reducing end alpha-L-arabinofuranosidase n=1 Tax=Roseateles saccharophilus TaxID=304 RepID=A0A4R3VF16_ROSSA|nr:alpha-L-arabinofuranosidase C-terminal domain-containing protein [Roseateles saccharophilus]MDG0835465.1 alpha-N-arabinofuranosidase [Roseateles saccharophilus]TCV04007.1 alpha-N-arabinofuranosidase [Roseateles saccharophilus]
MTLRINSLAAKALVAAFALCAATLASAQATQARLAVSLDEPSPRIEPTVYGHFVEHLGRGVYDGLWVGPESSIPNTRGWRNDVVQALRRVGIPVMRWPGGCFADDYDWRDGIGDPAKRPARRNIWWGGLETNRVGTHEFMDLVEQLDSEAYLSGNMGSMPPRAMAQWIEYITAGENSALTQERRRNGRDKPWKLKYFGVGNESFGCGGSMRPEYQSDLHNQYATFLKGVTRVASGDGEGDDHRVEVLMSRSARHMDAFTLHYYSLPDNWTRHGDATGFDAGAWARTLKSALGMDGRIEAIKRIMDKHDPDKRVALYVDEWGTWYDTPPGASALFQQNTLRDAVLAAVSFNIFHRHTDRVKMANIAQMVNVLQSMVLTEGDKMVLTPTYHAFDLYKPFRGATPLAIKLDAPVFRTGDVELPAVHASAARAPDGKLLLALVNLDPSHPARVATNLTGSARGRVLTAQSMDAHNTFQQPQAVAPAPYAAASSGLLDLPPKSVVVVEIVPRP